MASTSRDNQPGKTNAVTPPSIQHKYSTRTRSREEKETYSEDWAFGDEEAIEGIRSYNLQEKLNSTQHAYPDFVIRMDGKEFTISFLQTYGFHIPLLFSDKESLGLQVPGPKFSVNSVRINVGSKRTVDVIDVKTQKNYEMTMEEWTKYYKEPVKDKLLNVISLEFSHTKLENYIKRPNIVQEIDWVDCVWPKHLKESQTESTNVINDMMYPKVQKYCLMSVKGCYTDFHIDFGGTSVWYHILKGSKVFWLIPPTEINMKLYIEWTFSGRQNDTFFADHVEKCGRVSLNAGDTIFLPSGWIYAVYTTKDSLVFGGHFLHYYGIEKQLRVAQLEDSIEVPQKFRYPFFTEMLWYVLERYVYRYLGISHLEESAKSSSAPVERIYLTKRELSGMKEIVKYLHNLPSNKKNVPHLIKNASELMRNVAVVVNEHKILRYEYVRDEQFIYRPEYKKREIDYKTARDNMNKRVKIRKTGNSAISSSRRRRTRCKKCEACKKADCGKCVFCIDMVKFGGPGRAKQTCLMRQCLQPILPITAVCRICSLDGWNQKKVIPIQKTAKDGPSRLVECCVCFDIVHPYCLSKTVSTNYQFNKDIPNSWECPKCCIIVKDLENKPHISTEKRFKKNEKYSHVKSESDMDIDPKTKLSLMYVRDLGKYSCWSYIFD